MPPKSATWIAEGIYRDAKQWYATRRVRGAGFREERFPLSVPIESVQQWRETERVKLLGTAERGSLSGTFRRDAARYLKDFTTHLASRGQRKVEVMAWVREFGDRARGTIKPGDVARVRATWLAKGTAPKTINNRTITLAHLYRCLDGKKAWTPCDDLGALPVHKTPMRFVDDATILKVDRNLQLLETEGLIIDRKRHRIRGPKTRARFRVLVSTGRRASEVMRTQPGDLDLIRRIWIPRDGKGGFSPGIYLNDDMLSAWQFFAEVDAWGPYDTDEQAKRLYTAGWPKDIRPYQARHTVGITLSERGFDLQDIGPMMGHKNLQTTRKHYVPVLNSRLQKASESLAGRFKGWELQTGLQTTKAKGVKKRPNLSHQQTGSTTRTTGGKRRISSMKKR